MLLCSNKYLILMRKIVIVAFAMLMLAACVDSKKKYAKALLQEWIGKEVSFPSSLFFTIPNGDTVRYHIGKKYKRSFYCLRHFYAIWLCPVDVALRDDRL